MTVPEIQLDHPALKRAASVREVADFLNVNSQFVERQIHSGRLKAFKLSRKVLRILPTDLVDYLGKHTTVPTNGEPVNVPVMAVLVRAAAAPEEAAAS